MFTISGLQPNFLLDFSGRMELEHTIRLLLNKVISYWIYFSSECATVFSYLLFYFVQTFQAQLVGLLPPSPHRMPRGQHRGEDPDNIQVQYNLNLPL